jgi:hypothetical protein
MLQRVHPARLPEFEKYKDEVISKEKGKQTRPHDDESTKNSSVKKSRQTSLIPTASQGLSLSLSQSSVDNLIIEYIAHEMRPLVTVEKPAFRKLLQGINPQVNVMCRKTLTSRLNDKFEKMTATLKSELSQVESVCTTADIWSVNHKSYMGMTVHYIAFEPSNEGSQISRVSAALACKRFLGSHTYDRIAELICEVHTSFGLSVDKISATVTDNASNFGKAFREFMIAIPYATNENNEELLSVEEDVEVDVDVVNVADVMTNGPSEDCDIVMPHHETCFSHSLNLLATVDANKACESDATYKRLYRAATAKCSALWNATHRSSKASDAVRAVTDKAIITPGATRWNGQYDAIKRILEIGGKIGDVCQAADVPKFKQLELDCLEEYVLVMQPIATAIDKMQAEHDAYFGTVLPTLFTIHSKLKGFVTKPLKHSAVLVSTLITGLENRFSNELALNFVAVDKIVAAVSHPFFKLRWLPEDKKEMCRAMFISAVQRYDKGHERRSLSDQNQTSSTADDFFQFHDTPLTEIAVSEVEKECISYLSDCGTELQMLQRYSKVKDVFIKYNTTLPSSAPVERLFSTAGQIEVPRRNLLSDSTFEKLLLLKANRKFD